MYFIDIRKTVRLWDMRARQRLPLQILDDAKDSVMDVCISGDKIYTASVDGYVRTYDLRAGQLRQDYLDRGYPLLLKGYTQTHTHDRLSHFCQTNNR